MALINFETTKSGIINSKDSKTFFLRNEATSSWDIVEVKDIDNPDVKTKLNNIMLTVGNQGVTRATIETLALQFPNGVRRNLTTQNMFDIANRIEHGFTTDLNVPTDVSTYYSEKDYVIVDGRRYRIGENLTGTRHLYKVVRGSDGNAELKIAEDVIGLNQITVSGSREVELMSVPIDYTKQRQTIVPTTSDSTASVYNDGNPRGEKAFYMDDPGNVWTHSESVREFKSSNATEMLYWECVELKKGSKVDVREPVVTTHHLNSISVKNYIVNASSPGGKVCGDFIYTAQRAKGPAIWEPISRATGVTFVYATSEFGQLVDTWDRGFIYRSGSNLIAEVFTVIGYGRKKWWNEVAAKFGAHKGGHDLLAYARQTLRRTHYSSSPIDMVNNKLLKNNLSGVVRTRSWFKRDCKTTGPHSGPVKYSSVSEKTKSIDIKGTTLDIDFLYSTKIKERGDTTSRATISIYLKGPNGFSEKLVEQPRTVGATQIKRSFRGLQPGRYYLQMDLKDTYQDLIPSEGHISNVTFKETKTYPPSKDLDTTTVQVNFHGTGGAYMELWTHGDKANSYTLINDGQVQCFRVVVPPGGTGKLTITLRKGGYGLGGHLGNGGSAKLTQGVIKYNRIVRKYNMLTNSDVNVSNIVPMPPDSSVELGRDPQWGHTPEEPGGPGGSINPISDRFAWIDVLEILFDDYRGLDPQYQQNIRERNTCKALGTSVDIKKIQGSSKAWRDFKSKMSFPSKFTEDFNGRFVNDTDEVIEFELTFTPEKGGGKDCYAFSQYSGGFRYQGEDEMYDVAAPTELSDFHIVAIGDHFDDSVYTGGCNGSYLELLVYNEFGSLVKRSDPDDRIYDYQLLEGDSQFLAFPKGLRPGTYTFAIALRQKGLEDEYGFDNRSTMWINHAAISIKSRLRERHYDSIFSVYQDGQLMGYWDKGVPLWTFFDFPVKAGTHTYKFRFETKNKDFNWDFVEIDWILLTNWLCDYYVVVPQCDPGSGHDCIPGLIETRPPEEPEKPQTSEGTEKIWIFT